MNDKIPVVNAEYLEKVYSDQKEQIKKDGLAILETLKLHNVIEMTDAG